MTEERVQFVVQGLHPLQQRCRLPVLHLLPLSKCSIVCCRHCLVFGGCDSKQAGCQVDLRLTQVALCWEPQSALGQAQ